jgi:4-hydroxybenzoate polyprenyltransferase
MYSAETDLERIGNDGGLLHSVLRSLRAEQWAKNLLLFAGLIFGGRLRDVSSALIALSAFCAFCVLSSAIYLINDVVDREADRRHPLKSKRPVASGVLGVRAALIVACALLAAGLLAAAAIGARFLWVALAYVLLMVTYSIVLKRQVILDALTIAGGFVLRALGGATAVGVPFSHWLLLLTLLLALFLALTKRRAELVALGDEAIRHRQSLAHYSPALLDQMIAIVTSSTILAYAFYAISPETIARFGTDRLLLTVPFPLYGVFRYLYLVYRRAGGGRPSEELFSDRPLLVCVGLWAMAVIFIIYGPPRVRL